MKMNRWVQVATIVVVIALLEGGGVSLLQLVRAEAGAAYPLSVDAVPHGEVAKLIASDTANADEFGVSVAISGDIVVIGARGEDGAGSNRGAAYIFERYHGRAQDWGEVAKLIASDAADGDSFGDSVAISGDTVVVGAGAEDGAGTDRGAAYVYERNQGGADNWGQVAKLTASDAQDSDIFGHSVAISGDTVVVGAAWEDGGPGDPLSNAGAVYIFERNEGGADQWGQVIKLTASDAADGDGFGKSLAISEDTVVVGADWDSDLGYAFGSAYIFERNHGGPDHWGEVIELTASDAASQDNFGGSVSITGDTVVIAAHREDGAGSNRGAAYVFERNQGGTDNWGQVEKLTASDAADDSYFGRSVAISGDTVVVGADWTDCAENNCGAAYVYVRDEGGADNWGQVEKLTASDAEGADYFGNSVTIGEDIIVVGAHREDGEGSDRGAAYVFQPLYIIYLPLVSNNG